LTCNLWPECSLQMNQALKKMRARGRAGSNMGTAGEVVVSMNLVGMRGVVSEEVTVDAVEVSCKEKPPPGFSRFNEKSREPDGKIRAWQFSGIGSGTVFDPQQHTPMLVVSTAGLIARPVSALGDSGDSGGYLADSGDRQPFTPLVTESRALTKQRKEERETLRSASASAGAPLR
jgi:hypothetical protein